MKLSRWNCDDDGIVAAFLASAWHLKISFRFEEISIKLHGFLHGCFQKYGKTPKSSILIRFHYKPSILGVSPLFLGNTHTVKSKGFTLRLAKSPKQFSIARTCFLEEGGSPSSFKARWKQFAPYCSWVLLLSFLVFLIDSRLQICSRICIVLDLGLVQMGVSKSRGVYPQNGW